MRKQFTQLLAAGAMFFTLSMNAQTMSCTATMTVTNNGNNSYTFSGNYSSNNGTATAYPAWLLDGNYIGTGSSINYTAPDSLYHSVCLSVAFMDFLTGDSCVAYACDTIGYANPSGGGGGTSCQAGFFLWPDSLNPTVYYGYNTSVGGSGSTYLWDFGDGNTSTSQYPTHTYAATGVYMVCLTITDAANSCTDTYCDSLGVFKLAGPGMSQINILPPTPTGIKNNTAEISAFVSPNPLTEISSLTISADKAMKVQVQIVNVMGQTVSSEQIQLNAGKNAIQLKTNVLTEGIYFLNISNENKTLKNIKLVK